MPIAPTWIFLNKYHPSAWAARIEERMELAWRRESGLVDNDVRVQWLDCIKERILGRLWKKQGRRISVPVRPRSCLSSWCSCLISWWPCLSSWWHSCMCVTHACPHDAPACPRGWPCGYLTLCPSESCEANRSHKTYRTCRTHKMCIAHRTNTSCNYLLTEDWRLYMKVIDWC